MNGPPVEPAAPGSTARRERTDLYATILEVVKRYGGDGRVTRISYGAGMPVDRLRTSLRRLESVGLVRSVDRGEYTAYDITPRGQEFLNAYWKMKAFTELLQRPPPR